MQSKVGTGTSSTCVDCATVAEPVLVYRINGNIDGLSPDSADRMPLLNTEGNSNNTTQGKANGMPSIRDNFRSQGFSQEVTDILMAR